MKMSDPSRDLAVDVAKAMAAEEWPGCPWRSDFSDTEREEYMQRARVALSVVSKWLGKRAMTYDRQANVACDGISKMQGAALATAANILSGNMRAPPSAGRDGRG